MTGEQRRDFLVALARFGSPSRAARDTGINLRDALWERARYGDFADGWDHAMSGAIDRAELELLRRAVA